MTSGDVTVVNEWIQTTDKNDIYTKTWKPTAITTPIAILVMIHGFGEHIGRYDRLFSFFATQGIECYGYDQRGWGETGKKTSQFGNNQGYDTALKDIDDAVLKHERKDVPLFLMGHSMGGGLILNYLARGGRGVGLLTGAIASAPLVTLSMQIHAVKFYTIRALSIIAPSLTVRAGVDSAGLSHDQQEIQKYLDDPLVHDFATVATLKSIIDAGTDLLTKAKTIKTPILYSHADSDPINSFKGSQNAYEITSSQDKELKNWTGLYHEMHNETMPQRQEIAEYYVDWIKKRCPNYEST